MGVPLGAASTGHRYKISRCLPESISDISLNHPAQLSSYDVVFRLRLAVLGVEGKHLAEGLLQRANRGLPAAARGAQSAN